ncbi:MAG: DUF4350 domain-containing protein [Chloroflexi bacterium]|nr:DUF4350 domain-containing protein [Chloroflexota bacterium]
MFRRIPWEAILLIGLFVALTTFGVWFIRRESASQWRPPYHPESKEPDGSLVLWRWLERMGYQTRRLPPTGTALPKDVDMIILFPGFEGFSIEDAEMLHDWVAAGHILVLVDIQDDNLNEQFGVTRRWLTGAEFDPQLFQDLPLLPQAPAALTTTIITDHRFVVPESLPVLSHRFKRKGFPAVVVRTVGDGLVWHIGPEAAPTNKALQGDIRHLIPALLRTMPPGGVILIDVYHPIMSWDETFAYQRQPTLWSYFYTTSWGRAIALAGVLSFFFLFLQGKRLGPPLPALREVQRREASEYVKAMARLKQRARQRQSVSQYRCRRFRFAIANAWHIDAGLSTHEFVAALRQSDAPPTRDQLQRIEQVLIGMDAISSEADLVRLAAEADAILREMSISSPLS